MSFSYENCTLCARNCGVNRNKQTGFCKMGSEIYVARASLHMWEEPIISGKRGSGTIFFSGCSLLCSYCQNREISRGESGIKISVDRLAEIMLELESGGAENINLVTPTHFAPSIKEAVIKARELGLTLPIVYNTSSFENPNTIKQLLGIVDVYLADFKYYLPKTAKMLSLAENYPQTAKEAIDEMVKQCSTFSLNAKGLITRGVVVRILLLPDHVAEAKLILKYLFDLYGDRIYISLMNQYTPMANAAPPLHRKVTRAEYRELTLYAQKLGVKFGFTQQDGSASESFIPPFDNTGVVKKQNE